MFCHGGGGGQNFFYLLCVCVERVRFSTSPSVKKIIDPLLLITDGPYNKKPQGSLRRLSFFKILLGFCNFKSKISKTMYSPLE